MKQFFKIEHLSHQLLSNRAKTLPLFMEITKIPCGLGIVESSPMQPACLHELISESDRQMYQQKQSAAKETPVSDV